MKRTTGFLAALALAVAVAAVPAPAQAGPLEEKYVIVNSHNGDSLVDWFWIDELEGIIGCAKCGWLLDHDKSVRLSPADEVAFQQNLMTGLARLGDAKVATDPRTRAALRARALSHFTAAARALGAAEVRTGVVGYYDPERRTKVALHRDWLAAADEDVVNGLTLLQRSFSDPEPTPWVTAAAAEFDEAFAEIAAKKAIGS